MEKIPKINESKEVPEFIKKQLKRGYGFPIIDEEIENAIKEYDLISESPKNRAIIGKVEGDNDFFKKEDIWLYEKNKFYTEGQFSFYNLDGSIRLSDHWNTSHHDKTTFKTNRNYAYVAKKNLEESWDLLKSIRLYHAGSSDLAEKNRHLKNKIDKNKKEYSEVYNKIFNENSVVINELYDLRLDKAVDDKIRGWIANSAHNLLRLNDLCKDIEKRIAEIDDTYSEERTIPLLNEIKKSLNVGKLIELNKEKERLQKELYRRRYKDDQTSEYW